MALGVADALLNLLTSHTFGVLAMLLKLLSLKAHVSILDLKRLNLLFLKLRYGAVESPLVWILKKLRHFLPPEKENLTLLSCPYFVN